VRQPTRKAPAAARRAAVKKAAERQAVARKATGQKRAAVRNLVSRAAELGSRPATPAAAEIPADSAPKTPRPKVVAKQPPAEEDSDG
jgi:hypothetical protein